MNDKNDEDKLVDTSQIQLQAQSTIRLSDDENVNILKNQITFLMVPQPDQFKQSYLETLSEQLSNQEEFSKQTLVYNKFSGPQSVATDQYEKYRKDYHIKSNLNLHFEGNFKHDNTVLNWQNHEGTKAVILELKISDKKTHLKFTLFDSRYCQLATQKYQFDKQFDIKAFQFSKDDSFLAIQVDWDQYHFCYFQNGFENDLFEYEIGKISLENMLLTTFKIQGLEETKSIKFGIQNDNHFLLFVLENVWMQKISKKTVKQLMNECNDQNNFELSLNDDFDEENEIQNSKSIEIIIFDSPFIIGFDMEEKFYFIQNYELVEQFNIEDQNDQIDNNMLFQERNHLTQDQIVIYPNFTGINIEYQFFFFGSQYLFIYYLSSENNYQTLHKFFPIRFSESEFLKYNQLKIIEGSTIICQKNNFIYFYNIDFNKNKIVLKTKISGGFTHDLMKQSFQIFNCYDNILLQYYSSPFENHVSKIILNRIKSSNGVIGINCINEFLSYEDLIAYTQKAFPGKQYKQLNDEDLVFYSKKLNIFVNKGFKVHHLNQQGTWEIKDGQIKNLEMNNEEVLRIFDAKPEFNQIICYTFLQDNKMIQSFYSTNFESKFILSQDSDEIAILSQGCLNIITVNEQHQFNNP